MQSLLKTRAQPKLVVDAPGDRSERDADDVANHIMRLPADSVGRISPRIQRACSACQNEFSTKGYKHADEDEEFLQRSANDGVSGSSSYVPGPVESTINNVLGNGQALPESTRSFFEPRFGHDLSNVRIHTDSAAAETAGAVNARAYTLGRDIVFGADEFHPETEEGRWLLAHELTHTFQQGAAHPRSEIQRTIGDGHDLVSPRFALNVRLEQAFDNERTVEQGSRGTHVSLLQQSLIDMGYTLPGFGVDGIFGSETKAAIIRFQTDAGAVKIDGIVGPETMGLFDLHDTTRPGGIGPPQITGPVPGPLPAPHATCDTPYAGVTFDLANQVGTGVTPAVAMSIVVAGGHDALRMQGIASANYNPDITIHAPNNARAQEFQVGFASNLLSEFVEYFYTTASVLRSTLPTPTKDGRPLSSGQYDPVYVETPSAGVNELFAANGDIRHLSWPDVPSEFAFIHLLDNPECAALPAAGDLATAAFIDTFRTWVVVRHMPSGCTRALHHIDWDLNWQAIINMTAAGPTINVVSDVINVTEGDGDGTPAFIQGGQVPDDLIAANRVCA